MTVPAAATRTRVEGDAIHAEIEIHASPETVFRALTDPDELVAWWGSDDTYQVERWVTDLRVGGRWRSEGTGSSGDSFVVEGRFLEVEPPRRLVYTWEPSWAQGEPTTVRIDLEPSGAGTTRLVLEHDGFGDRREELDNHASGWPLVLGWMQAHVEAR